MTQTTERLCGYKIHSGKKKGNFSSSLALRNSSERTLFTGADISDKQKKEGGGRERKRGSITLPTTKVGERRIRGGKKH